MEGWQNGYCTGLENRRPKGLAGSNPSPSAIISTLLRSFTARLFSLPCAPGSLKLLPSSPPIITVAAP
jgi:hypothetical protein